MTIRLAPINPDSLAEAWPAVSPLVALACARSSGKFTPSDVIRAVGARAFQLWAGCDDGADHPVRMILITRLLDYPQLRACELLACVGDDREDWQGLIAEIERWAKRNGCALMQPIARPGWERVLKAHGYKKTHVMLEKVLA